MTGIGKYNMTLPWQPHFDKHFFPNLEFSCFFFFNKENNFLAINFNLLIILTFFIGFLTF